MPESIVVNQNPPDFDFPLATDLKVKMGTNVKSVNIDDVAVQHYVRSGCGLSISKTFLVHINNTYARQDALTRAINSLSAKTSAKLARNSHQVS